ncbi:major facilitator superfamily transporter [Apiospora rasikravindrae]|uniref:Major facilitator superfamily transporter n=1 Tax=Apiospora rasikravindrae TaxID=990691 RepID=A0ABR1U9Q1_9PEZI
MASPTASESKIEAQRDGPDVANSAVPPAYEDVPYSAVDEKKLVAKLDRRIVPLVMLSYTLSFLDRVNIGNARLYRLEEDLGLKGNQYQVAVSILFVTYLLFEVPSNLVLKPFSPSRWLAFIITAWGIVATLTGLVNNFGSLIACRLILGALEAGLFPGLNVYLTFFYTKHELALRVGYLFVSAAIAGAFGGLLAYGIGHMQGVAGLGGWRWIMILEGIPSVLLGVVIWFFLPNDAESASFLTDDEKKVMAARLTRGYGNTVSAQQYSSKDMLAAFKDWKVWMFCVAQFGVDTMLYGFSTFLPTIVKGLSGQWSSAEVQLLTVPCYFLGAVAYMAAAWYSDRVQRRAIFVVIFGCVSVVGYGILLSNSTSGVHYFGYLLHDRHGSLHSRRLAAGLGNCPTIAPRYGKRTTACGMNLTMGNMSGIMAPFIYLTAEGPRYIRGNAVSLSMVGMAVGLYGFLWFWFRRENKRRDAGQVSAEHAHLSEEDLMELGDESPHYRYTY